MVEAVNSVRKISQLEFDVLLTGHGSPVVGKASDKFRHLMSNVR